MEIRFEKEVCDYLSLPSIPKKVFDGKTSFKDGVAVTKLALGDLAYAICTFNAEQDKEPRIKKVFAQERFVGIEEIFVVPSYMDTNDIENADLDEQSKQAAERLAQEARDLTQGDEMDKETKEMETLPEWVFDNIHNKEEAQAFIRSWNSTNNIKGRIPENIDTLKMRLLTIYSEMKKRQ